MMFIHIHIDLMYACYCRVENQIKTTMYRIPKTHFLYILNPEYEI